MVGYVPPEDEEDRPLWKDLLLPEGVFRAGVGDATRLRDRSEEMPDVGELGSMLPKPPKRDYWLAKISSNGQLPIRAAWERIGEPAQLILTTSIKEPGVGLAGVYGSKKPVVSSSKELRQVSTTARSAMVFLGAAALSRLAVDVGDRVLMTVIPGGIILANPGWNPVFGFWDDAIQAQMVKQGVESMMRERQAHAWDSGEDLF